MVVEGNPDNFVVPSTKPKDVELHPQQGTVVSVDSQNDEIVGLLNDIDAKISALLINQGQDPEKIVRMANENRNDI